MVDYYDDGYDSHQFVNFLTDTILGGFFDAYKKVVHNDRSKVQNLMKIVIYYVTQASKVDMIYLRLKGVPRERIV